MSLRDDIAADLVEVHLAGEDFAEPVVVTRPDGSTLTIATAIWSEISDVAAVGDHDHALARTAILRCRTTDLPDGAEGCRYARAAVPDDRFDVRGGIVRPLSGLARITLVRNQVGVRLAEPRHLLLER